jgi:sugar lactone lactonase YvrE
MNHDLEILFDDAIFTESPRWHDDSLWFSDIGAGQVRRLWLDGRKETVVEGMAMPSGLGWMPGGDLLVASIGDSTVYRVGVEGVPPSPEYLRKSAPWSTVFASTPKGAFGLVRIQRFCAWMPRER